jgi:hypothetical protein
MSIEAMNQAFEVPLVEQLESVPTNARLVIDDADGMGTQYIPVGRMCHDASKALRQAIAEAEKQEPVAYISNKRQRLNIELKPQTFVEIPTVTDWEMPLYMKPSQRTWVGLTDEEILKFQDIVPNTLGYDLIQFAKAIQTKLKELNT